MTATSGGTCDTCGELNVAGTQFCTSCGSYLGWNAPAVPSADDGTPPPPRPLRAPPPPGGGDSTRPMARLAPAPPRISPSRAASGTSTLPPRTAAPVSVDVTCPSCASDNAPSRRFCRHCGFVLQSPVARPRPTAVRQPWWRRWFRRRPTAERAARANFRHSLSWRSRIFRGVCLLLALVAALGLLRFVGHDPLAWARHRVNDLRGTLVAVEPLTASVDPPGAEDPKFPAAAAVDGRTDTAWGGRWTDPSGGETGAGRCAVSPAAGTALLLTASKQVTLRAIRVRAGLPVADANRDLQWQPRVLELRFSDGRCQQVALKAGPDPQIVDLKAVSTNAVRISVVGAFAPSTPPEQGQVALTEVDLLSRPA